MSSVFSLKITMSTASGVFTGEGTPLKYRTGRKHTYRSRSCLSATLRERIPPPTGVVSGPLIPTRYSRNIFTVSSGSQVLNRLNAFSPAYTSFHTIDLPSPYALEIAASRTRLEARQRSGPAPSPPAHGITGGGGP